MCPNLIKHFFSIPSENKDNTVDKRNDKINYVPPIIKPVFLLCVFIHVIYFFF